MITLLTNNTRSRYIQCICEYYFVSYLSNHGSITDDMLVLLAFSKYLFCLPTISHRFRKIRTTNHPKFGMQTVFKNDLHEMAYCIKVAFYQDRRELFARKERCSAESAEFEVSGGTAANLRPDIRLTGDPEGKGLHLQPPRSAPSSEMRFFAGTSINGKILPEVQR